MAINDELKKVYLDANVDIILVDTLELIHPSFSQNWYLVKDRNDFQGKIENGDLVDYQVGGFDFIVAETNSKGQSNAQFVIDATDETILSEFWAYKADPTIPIVLNWRQYFSTSPEIQTSTLGIKLMDIEFKYSQISGAGSRPDIVNRPFPNRRYDTTVFKGLNYV